MSEEEIQQKWLSAQGDRTFRLNYDLNAASLVVDAGGYQGEWSANIFNKYHCKVYIFEPVFEFYHNIEMRFLNTPKIKVFNYGLAGRNRTEVIAVCADSSSIFRDSDRQVPIKLIDSVEFFDWLGLDVIDLIKINIEGGEYELLDHLLKTGFIKKIKNIQVQFHQFVKDARARSATIQHHLSKTHYLTYQFPFVWENWLIKQE